MDKIIITTSVETANAVKSVFEDGAYNLPQRSLKLHTINHFEDYSDVVIEPITEKLDDVPKDLFLLGLYVGLTKHQEISNKHLHNGRN